MTLSEEILTIAMCVQGTVATRALPFLIFSSGRTPPLVRYLGKALPSAVFAMLVVYCLKDVSLVSGNHGIPEALGIAATVALHLWKRQFLLSIAGGTVAYMALVQCVFPL